MARKIADLRILQRRALGARRGRPGARRQPVHPLRRHPQGPPPLVERRRAGPVAEPVVEQVVDALRARGVEVHDRPVRRPHGRRARQRRPRDDPARRLTPTLYPCRRSRSSRAGSSSASPSWPSGVEVYALVDCVRRRPDAFVAAGKRTKQFWLLVTGVATLLGVVALGALPGILAIVAIVAAGVYLADVKPALDQVMGRGAAHPGALRPLVRRDGSPRRRCSSPSRQREGPSSTGHPASRIAPAVAMNRCRMPYAACGACRAHAASSSVSSRCTPSPGTLRWISALAAARPPLRALQPAQPPAQRQAPGRPRSRPPRSPAGPARRTCRRRAGRRAPAGHGRRPGVGHLGSSYWRSTLNARTTTGRAPPGSGTSNPRRRTAAPAARAGGRPPPAPGRSRCHHLDVGPHPPQPVVQLERRDRGGAVAEVDHDGRAAGLPPQPPRLRTRQPAVAAAQPVGVRRPPGDDPDRSLLATPQRGSSRPAPRSAGPGASTRHTLNGCVDWWRTRVARGRGQPLDGRARRLPHRRAGPRPHLVGAPPCWSATSGSPTSSPGLLQVAQGARGVQSLGAGLSVTLYDSGFRLARGSTVLADTVTRGAPVTAVMGALSEVNGHPREEITSDAHARADRRGAAGQGHRRYSGVVHDDTTQPAAAHRVRADRRPDPDGCRGARCRRRRDPPRLAPGDERASPRPCPSATCASAPTGSTRRSSSSRPSPGCSAPTCRSARCRCRAPSTCARTAGSPCTCGPPGRGHRHRHAPRAVTHSSA